MASGDRRSHSEDQLLADACLGPLPDRLKGCFRASRRAASATAARIAPSIVFFLTFIDIDLLFAKTPGGFGINDLAAVASTSVLV